MSNQVDYWKSRGKKAQKSFRRFLKEDVFFSNLFNLRAGTEGFLKSEINKIKRETSQSELKILDIACGWGVSFASNKDVNFYGVDIEGFPKETTIDNGYKDAKEYGENMSIPYSDDFFDVCTIVNLNAHIPSATLKKILLASKKKLKKKGYFLLVAELDNRGLSYQILRKLASERLNRMILGMDHTNFLFESEFDSVLEQTGIEICYKKTITGNMLPTIHYIAWAFNKSPYKLLKYPSFIADFGFSLIDNTLTLAGLGGEGKRFIVGYKCRFI